jgi:alpha-beta hydrolase superfamily lysophospholipase
LIAVVAAIAVVAVVTFRYRSVVARRPPVVAGLGWQGSRSAGGMHDDRTRADGPDTNSDTAAAAAPLREGVILGTVPAHDGAGLSYARVDLGVETGRVLVFLHGIGSYGGLYYHMAEPLRGAVDTVYFPDMRGHGRSTGERGDLKGRACVIRDIRSIMDAVHEAHPDSAVILGGESMGGLLSLGFAADQPDSIDALVLAAPALKLNTRRLRTRDSIKRGLEGLRPSARSEGPREPSGIPVTGAMPNEVPRDPAFLLATEGDPLVLKSVSIKYLLVLATFIWNWGGRYPRRLAEALGTLADGEGTLPEPGPLSERAGGPLPVLILQGGADIVLDPAGARRLNDLIPQAEYAEFDESWHNLFWDPESPRVLARMAEWLRGLGRHGASPE